MEAVAKLKDLPIAPRKIQLVVELVRGVDVMRGISILRHTPKKCAIHVEKLLRSAISNWKQAHGASMEEVNLYVKSIEVGHAGMLKRMRPAPQGRGHRIRKRSSNIRLVVGVKPLSPKSDSSKKEDVSVLKNKTKEKETKTVN